MYIHIGATAKTKIYQKKTVTYKIKVFTYTEAYTNIYI